MLNLPKMNFLPLQLLLQLALKKSVIQTLHLRHLFQVALASEHLVQCYADHIQDQVHTLIQTHTLLTPITDAVYAAVLPIGQNGECAAL